MFVCCECCVLSGTGLCDELITRPEESYWMWCVRRCVWSRNLVNEEALAHWGLLSQKQTNKRTNIRRMGWQEGISSKWSQDTEWRILNGMEMLEKKWE